MFQEFKTAVQKQFALMAKHQLFRVALDKDALWALYLSSYPEGTNLIHKTRTEYDCQCCRSFIKAVGNVVAIIDGNIVTIWDGPVGHPYTPVSAALSAMVKASPIENAFLHPEQVAGTDRSFQQITGEAPITWDHFFIRIPNENFCSGRDIGTKLGGIRSTYGVALRGLKELTVESCDTVLELIAQNSLLRGAEHKAAIEAFLKLKKQFDKLPDDTAKEMFVWQVVTGKTPYAASIRNTVIGTLLVAISDGEEFEGAVASFEDKVHGSKYKRPTALITQSMIKSAQNKLTELGFLPSLDRRHATIRDITINNIVFANRAARAAMDVFATMANNVPVALKQFDKVEQVGIEDFIKNILPKAQSLEVLFENRHAANVMSLVAPVDATAKGMFKWDNNYSWSYAGEVADSMTERVKKAGGRITGDLLCRLAWNNTDDLDFHMKEPGGYKIFFSNKRTHSPCGGILDVDANGGDGIRKDPVENIVYTDKKKMKEGVYELLVHQYCLRSRADVGFDVEIEFDGTVHTFSYPKIVSGLICVAKIKYSKATGFTIIESLPSSTSSKVLHGITTQQFQPVSLVMNSPNHWDGQGVGNKHYFFIIDGFNNEDPVRGFYNEFLNGELDAHRKVLEVLGSKTKVADSTEQLSGLGFSSTQRNSLLVRVTGSFNRVVQVNF